MKRDLPDRAYPKGAYYQGGPFNIGVHLMEVSP